MKPNLAPVLCVSLSTLKQRKTKKYGGGGGGARAIVVVFQNTHKHTYTHSRKRAETQARTAKMEYDSTVKHAEENISNRKY
jgi:hypothetical protein